MDDPFRMPFGRTGMRHVGIAADALVHLAPVAADGSYPLTLCGHSVTHDIDTIGGQTCSACATAARRLLAEKRDEQERR